MGDNNARMTTAEDKSRPSATEDRLMLTSGRFTRRIEREFYPWILVGLGVFVCFLLRDEVSWLLTFPNDIQLPISDWINIFMDWFVATFRWLFRAISWTLGWPMTWLQGLFHWLPWPATITILVAFAYAAKGWKLALFTACALLYMVVIGYWEESMRTLALVGVSVPLSVLSGGAVGLLAFRYRLARKIIEPLLDLMQVVPTFVYLIPALLLFGFGPVVGIIASAIYAAPPMARNMMLGLSRVPKDAVESGQMSGATNLQLLWWIQIPSAMPTIIIGINQTIMAAFAMVIIAAVIGGSADIGWEVLSSMRRARFAESLFSGVVITLMAMIMDRASRAFAEQRGKLRLKTDSFWQRHRNLCISIAVVGGMIVLGKFIDPMRAWPESLVFFPAEQINNGLGFLIENYGFVFSTIKKWSLFYFMMPIRLGLEGSVRPHSWGFELTLPISLAYAGAVTTFALGGLKFYGWRVCVSIAVIGAMFYFGITATPWPAFIAVVTLIAWQTGGWKLGVGSLLGLAFMLLTGVWEQAMLSVYLCGAAVFLSFVVGCSLGVWASHNDSVSAFLRPINDTLQSMPLFVFLIPVVMFFKIGDFTALLAIAAYAVVPGIRYTEHGIRNVQPDIVEAARALGCTKRQIFWQVELPLALPEIMLGLNQIVMFALAMLVITSLVGTKGLGMLVYVALSSADVGKGFVAGLSMALIAIIIDRIIQSWSKKKKAELGLA